MPKKMSEDTVFYHKIKAVNIDFAVDAVSSDGGVLLLSKNEPY